MQPFKLSQKEWKRETVKHQLHERLYEIETPEVVHCTSQENIQSFRYLDIDLLLPVQEVSLQPQVIYKYSTIYYSTTTTVCAKDTCMPTTAKSPSKTRIPVPFISPIRTVKPPSYLMDYTNCELFHPVRSSLQILW